MNACRLPVIEPSRNDPSSYGRALRALAAARAPFLVGGALALAAYSGIRRKTKDLDIFVLETDVRRVLDVLERVGFRTETPFPHWLAKAHAGERFIDVIFNSGNGAAPVDDEWFAHAVPATVFGTRVAMCPVEETIWSKAFVMERERFDGADVIHLLDSCAETMDWPRLVRRFGHHWRVLLSHLVLFGFVYPDGGERVPEWVMDELVARLGCEPRLNAARDLCRGTLLSREQYLPDLARGAKDGRLPPTGTMSCDEIAIWSGAIERT